MPNLQRPQRHNPLRPYVRICSSLNKAKNKLINLEYTSNRSINRIQSRAILSRNLFKVRPMEQARRYRAIQREE